MPEANFTIRRACRDSELAAAATLFRDYAASLGIDLGYQGFEGELAGLPGKYAPPWGALLLAFDEQGQPLGCIALRFLAAEVGEIKRLYVDPRGRGLGIGKALLNAIIAVAESAGYRELRLDTLPTMLAARALYREDGFVESSAYYDSPIEETVFMVRVVEAIPR